MEPKFELTKQWIDKSLRDFEGAEAMANREIPYLDLAVYHFQQSAEKAIKAYLVFCDQPFEKIHDIEKLIQLAMKYSIDFSILIEDGKLLTPFATKFRYPGEEGEPDREEYERLLSSTKKIYEFVLSKIPKETHPE